MGQRFLDIATSHKFLPPPRNPSRYRNFPCLSKTVVSLTRGSRCVSRVPSVLRVLIHGDSDNEETSKWLRTRRFRFDGRVYPNRRNLSSTNDTARNPRNILNLEKERIHATETCIDLELWKSEQVAGANGRRRRGKRRNLAADPRNRVDNEAGSGDGTDLGMIRCRRR